MADDSDWHQKARHDQLHELHEPLITSRRHVLDTRPSFFHQESRSATQATGPGEIESCRLIPAFNGTALEGLFVCSAADGKQSSDGGKSVRFSTPGLEPGATMWQRSPKGSMNAHIIAATTLCSSRPVRRMARSDLPLDSPTRDRQALQLEEPTNYRKAKSSNLEDTLPNTQSSGSWRFGRASMHELQDIDSRDGLRRKWTTDTSNASSRKTHECSSNGGTCSSSASRRASETPNGLLPELNMGSAHTSRKTRSKPHAQISWSNLGILTEVLVGTPHTLHGTLHTRASYTVNKSEELSRLSASSAAILAAHDGSNEKQHGSGMYRSMANDGLSAPSSPPIWKKMQPSPSTSPLLPTPPLASASHRYQGRFSNISPTGHISTPGMNTSASQVPVVFSADSFPTPNPESIEDLMATLAVDQEII